MSHRPFHEINDELIKAIQRENYEHKEDYQETINQARRDIIRQSKNGIRNEPVKEVRVVRLKSLMDKYK